MGGCVSVQAEHRKENAAIAPWDFADFRAPSKTESPARSTSVHMIFEELSADDGCNEVLDVVPVPGATSSVGGLTICSWTVTSGWSTSQPTGSRYPLCSRDSSVACCSSSRGPVSQCCSTSMRLAGSDIQPSSRSGMLARVPALCATDLMGVATMLEVSDEDQQSLSVAASEDRMPSEPLRMPRWGAFPTPASELAVDAVLGGGRATVFKGRWHNTPVAVKILDTRGSEVEAARHATEMAMMSAIHHPHLVEAVTCFTDVVEGSGPDFCGDTSVLSIASIASHSHTAPGAAIDNDEPPLSSGRPPKYLRRLLPGEDPDGPVFNVIVMELCSAGTLRSALDRGALPATANAAPGAVGSTSGSTLGLTLDVPVATELLLDAATGLAHLHSMRIAHGDVRAENILLAPNTARATGVVAKVGGFGCAAVLDEQGHELGLVASLPNGDATAGPGLHLARTDSLATSTTGIAKTQAADVRAFGAVLWEVLARVCREDANVQQAPDGRDTLAALASACWADSPPAMEDVAGRLAHLSAAHRLFWQLRA